MRFFEKDTVEWGTYSKADFYRQLNELNHTREGFGMVILGCASVLKTSADTRVCLPKKNGSTVVVMLNLSDATNVS